MSVLAFLAVAAGAGLPRTDVAPGRGRVLDAEVLAGAGAGGSGSAAGSGASGCGSDVKGGIAGSSGVDVAIGGIDTAGTDGLAFADVSAGVGPPDVVSSPFVSSTASEDVRVGVLRLATDWRGVSFVGEPARLGWLLCRRGCALSDCRRAWFSNLARRVLTSAPGRSIGSGTSRHLAQHLVESLFYSLAWVVVERRE